MQDLKQLVVTELDQRIINCHILADRSIGIGALALRDRATKLENIRTQVKYDLLPDGELVSISHGLFDRPNCAKISQ